MILLLLLSVKYGIAPIILAAGISAAASGASALATGKQNKKSRKFQEKMFDRTNQYNSPLEQRKRLEAAGLNPNMVYGGSSGGTAGTASQPSKPDFNTPDIADVGTKVAQGALEYYQSKNIQSATDVNEAREKEINQTTVNKGIDAVNKAIAASGGTIDLKTKKALYDTNIKKAHASLENLGLSNEYLAGKNRREDMITEQTVSKLKQEISNAKKQGSILGDEAIMKRLDRILYQDYKVRPDDPFYAKIVTRLMQELNLDLKL